VIVSDASRGDVRHADLTELKKGVIGDLRFMADADAPVSECELNIRFGYRCRGDGRRYAEVGRQLSEQGGFVPLASIDRNSRRDGR
jgi:hypothetical protein